MKTILDSKHQFVLIKPDDFKKLRRRMKSIKLTKNNCGCISRNDIFKHVRSKADTKDVLTLIAYWAYPDNTHDMREKIISHKKTLAKLSKEPKQLKDSRDLKRLIDNYKLSGIGMTTISKLLYFFGFSFKQYHCLILDNTIVNSINSGCLDHLFESKLVVKTNSLKSYIKYLSEIDKIAKKNKSKPDQVEFTIFMLGSKYLI